MPTLLLLEPGVVIYRNVTFPSPPSPSLPEAWRQQILIYCCPGAQGNKPPVPPLPTNQAQAPALAESCFLFGNVEREREREHRFAPFPGGGRPRPPWNHITNYHVNLSFSHGPAHNRGTR